MIIRHRIKKPVLAISRKNMVILINHLRLRGTLAEANKLEKTLQIYDDRMSKCTPEAYRQ